MITYTTKLIPESQEDLDSLRKILEWEKYVFNEASKVRFELNKNSIVALHAGVYRTVRNNHPEIPSQVIICGEQACLSAYSSIRSNKHKISKPAEKKRLSIRLDKRLYSKIDKTTFRITTANKRRTFRLVMYPRLQEMFDKYEHGGPILNERNGDIYISIPFKNETEPVKQKLALGVDLGIRVAAACSDGRLFIDRKFNKEKRKLRFLKRQLQAAAKQSRSARKHLEKLRHKERNKNRNQTHLITNAILQTSADTIALENLKGIKAKRFPTQNKNRISQVPLFALRQTITYKANNMGKHVILVNPAYTSQTDSLTGKREGERRGRRFYAKSKLIYDADLNAARNIGQRSKLPVSYGNILDGQASVTRLNADKPYASGMQCKPSTSVVGM